MIYLIECSKTNSCKIGYASNPENRLAQLQTGNPFALDLISTIEGDIPKEKEIHKLFKEFRLKGEWFIYNQKIKEYFNVEDEYKIYKSMITILKKSSDVKIKLFASLLERYSRGQEFSMNKGLKEIIAKETNCKARSLDTSFTELVRANVIVKIEVGLYKINPRHIFQGSSINRNNQLKAIIELGCKDC